MAKIFIVRHGQDQDNVQKILNGHRNKPLTQQGLLQARQLAEHINQTSMKFDFIYSSPLARAYATALMISGTATDAPTPLDLLIERDFGIMSGKSTDDIEKFCAPHIIKTDTITYFLNPEGAETFPQLLARGQAVLDYIAQNHSAEESILLVCHGDIGKMIYAAYYKLDWKDVLIRFHFGNSEMLMLAKGSTPENSHVFKQEQFNH